MMVPLLQSLCPLAAAVGIYTPESLQYAAVLERVESISISHDYPPRAVFEQLCVFSPG